MGLWVLILVATLNNGGRENPAMAISQEFQSQAACENAENFIRQDLEKRGMAKSEKIAGGCVMKW